MTQKSDNKTEERGIEATEWVGHGTGVLRRRDALPASHPESWASLWIKKYGDLDGFPSELAEIQGARKNEDEVYFKCKHCQCINVYHREEIK